MAWDIEIEEFDERSISPELEGLMNQHPHLESYVESFNDEWGKYPEVIDELGNEHTVIDHPNYLHEIDDAVFVHIFGDIGESSTYHAIEPTISRDEREAYFSFKRETLNRNLSSQLTIDDIDDIITDAVRISDEETTLPGGDSLADRVWRLLAKVSPISKLELERDQFQRFRYQFKRDVLGLGPLKPLLSDPNIEDIHVLGRQNTFVDHGVFGMLPTNIDFGTPEEFDSYLTGMTERIGNPVSDAEPIVDGTLPDGSRLNVIYSDDISVQGPTLTIRQQDEVPLTISAITRGGTFSPTAAAYMWLALENESSVFVVGETASGKTTTLNSLTTFIPPGSKIYTAEDTAEVIPPHDTWQQLLTRETPGESSKSDIDLFDLVVAALRSRPDYIIVGEVRGEEGRMAFQAIQTGHPVMLTFHAADIKSMVQRFTSNPINVPYPYMDNLDVAIFQNFIKGDDYRRVTSIHEIEEYSKHADGLVTKEVFEWESSSDDLIFKGQNNSTLLEDKIAGLKGYTDRSRIYADLELRKRIIQQMVYKDIVGFQEVNETINAFQRDGVEGLPFDVNVPGELLV
jgi:flagellar protein FlaI